MKGPNDRLSMSQMVWLEKLSNFGAHALVCHVESEYPVENCLSLLSILLSVKLLTSSDLVFASKLKPLKHALIYNGVGCKSAYVYVLLYV